jgi:hypothetical protein
MDAKDLAMAMKFKELVASKVPAKGVVVNRNEKCTTHNQYGTSQIGRVFTISPPCG